jgi:nucleotide-binding universal stress UspA family protein
MMLKSILVALDGTADGEPAVELALAWGAHYGAGLVGLAVVDEPGIRVAEGDVLGGLGPGAATLLAESRSRCEEVLRRFETRCREQGLGCRTVLENGAPHGRIVAESHRSDLVMIGQRTHFEHGWTGESDGTQHRLIQEGARPVVAVPAVSADPIGAPALVAFDGSPRASRALYDFVATGLGAGREVHVLSVDRTHDAAERVSEKAVEFLRLHELDARPHPFDGAYQAQHAIFGASERLGAALLVIGAFGQGALKELFLGSTTRNLLENATVPVFCSH